MLKSKSIKTKGFSLIEAVVALLITCICVLVLSDATKLIKHVNKKDTQENRIAFCAVQLDEFLYAKGGFYIDEKQTTSKELVIRKRVAEEGTKITAKNPEFKTYVLEQYRDMIRVRGDTSGHMPLFMGIKKLKIEVKDEQFILSIYEKNNELSQLVYRANLTKEDEGQHAD